MGRPGAASARRRSRRPRLPRTPLIWRAPSPQPDPLGTCRRNGRSGRPPRWTCRTRGRTPFRRFPPIPGSTKLPHYTDAARDPPRPQGSRNQTAQLPVGQNAEGKFRAALRRGAPVRLQWLSQLFGSRILTFKGPDLISIRHAIHQPTANGLSSLAARRRQIRRQRRSAVRALASGAGWGAVILLSLWLLFSGIFGFLSA